jgi:acyl carrier protein
MEATPAVKAEQHADTIARLDAAVRFGLSLPDGMDLTPIAYGEIEEWDSVAHMQLVAAIEAAFGIMIDTDDVVAMSDYVTIRRILREHHGIES